MPFFPVLGNHELRGDPAGERAEVLRAALRGPRYYAFLGRRTRIDRARRQRATCAEQTAWLNDELEGGGGVTTHTFVFVHQPPFSLGDHCGTAPAQAEWVRLFEHYRVRAGLAGHDHAYERMERNGVQYFVTGGGGEPCTTSRRVAD